MGMVGYGKSTTLNQLLGYKEDRGGKQVIKQVFAAGSAAKGIKTNMARQFNVNPTLLPDSTDLIVSDSEGIGSSANDSVQVADSILELLKNDPATLLIVHRFHRTDMPFVRVLQMLKVCTNISSSNCFLLLTFAQDHDIEVSSFDADPSRFLDELKANHGIDFFDAEHNVMCIDMDSRAAKIPELRTQLLARMPVKASMTYLELVALASNNHSNASDAVSKLRKELADAESDRGWHEQRIKDLNIAIASTGWIPFVGTISAAGMAIAVASSIDSVKSLNKKIADLSKKAQNGRESQAHYLAKLNEYKAMIQ
ncbi:hypothetical protein H9P43_005374 [Blastocladiella emersonii ATCC 22665]|nr:hypothetical protein H9P43_005374 [Blastocladiella emersonii ATCC 22665]